MLLASPQDTNRHHAIRSLLARIGSGDFALTDSNALTLTSATTGGNASFTTSNADLTLASDPAVAGNLSLLTTGTGNVLGIALFNKMAGIDMVPIA